MQAKRKAVIHRKLFSNAELDQPQTNEQFSSLNKTSSRHT